jgi:mono/diheme cytochrome c family protein
MRHITRITLGLLCLSALVGCRGEPSRKPPVHPNQNMDLQDKYKPQRESSFFEDKRAMRKPVEGAVGSDFLKVAYGVTKGGVASHDDRYLQEDDAYWRGLDASGQPIAALPAQVKADKAFMERGQQRYNIFCAPCHGLTGYGDGVVKSVGKINVPSYHQDYMREYAAGHIFGVISNGSASQLMKGYKHQIPVEDRWAVVAYVRALQRSQYGEPGDRADSPSQEAR